MFLMESHLGRASLGNQGSKMMGGFAMWNYWNLTNYQTTQRNVNLGVGVPLRFNFIHPDEELLVNYDNSVSLAALFRLDIQSYPGKKGIWVFFGAGPEYRLLWDGRDSQGGLPLMQAEFGIKIDKPNALIIDNAEIGFTTSMPLRKREFNDRLYFASFFVRIEAF
jgi:hypothetical protein